MWCIPVMRERERLPRRICSRWHPLAPYYPSLYLCFCVLYLYIIFYLFCIAHLCVCDFVSPIKRMLNLELDIFICIVLLSLLYLYCSQVLLDHCWLLLSKFLALFNCLSTVDPLLTLFSNCFTIALCNTPLLAHQLHAIPLQYCLYRYRYNYTHTHNWLLPHNW